LPARTFTGESSTPFQDTHNNGAERSLRGIAVGRKNWMFYGSDNGGQTAALLTSLIATCKRLGMDPFAYLRDLFGRIVSLRQLTGQSFK
jgi:hypothetical protein